ncbi:MAG TPA: carbohydrate porin, partial [Candidatus Binatia bacterium]
ASGKTQASPSDSPIRKWDKLHKQLDDRGIQIGVRYDGEIFVDAAGGLRRGAAYLGNLNLQLTLDAERLVGWPGATVFLYGLGIHGGRPSKRFVGDAQGVSSIEAPAKWKIEEGWIQQNLFDNRLSALAGRYDLNSEFYRLQSAGLFLNSSFGIGPEFSQSGREGPSIFPNTSVGARLAIKPIEEVVLRTAVLDGVPVERPNGAQAIFARDDGLLIVTEAAYLHRPLGPEQPRTRGFRIGRNCCGTYAGKLALGAWYYSAKFDDLTETHPNGRPVRRRGSGGFYLLADGTVYQDAQNSDRQLNLFGQLGIGDPRVNRFAYYTGAGLTVAALVPGRAQDELGFAVAAAHNGSQFMEVERNLGLRQRRSEVALELTYLAQFGSRLALQPDLQYVIHPNTDPRIKNAFVFMLRFELSL